MKNSNEFAALHCSMCALCYLHSLGAAPCFLHQVTPASAVIHLVAGLDGTGGWSILGTIVSEVDFKIDSVRWIVIHVLDNQQAQSIAGIEAFAALRCAIPVSWSPMWYAQANTLRRMPRQIGTRIIGSHILDSAGEYLITVNTEEWCRLLFARDEAPMES